MRVLITGGSGLLGRYLLKTAPKDWDIYPTYCANKQQGKKWIKMDMIDSASIANAFAVVQPDVVIHAAGDGRVDVVENNFHLYNAVNVCGSFKVFALAYGYKAKMVYVSSNAVFDSSQYARDDLAPRHPENMYGHSKHMCELALGEQFDFEWSAQPNTLVVRPILMYGWPPKGARTNWAVKITDELSRGNHVRMVTDVVTQPLYAGDCAHAIWHLIKCDAVGNVNIGGQTVCDMYHFGRMVASAFDLDKDLILKAKLDDFPGLAPRPRDTHYNLRRMEEYGYKTMSLSTGLYHMVKEVDHE